MARSVKKLLPEGAVRCLRPAYRAAGGRVRRLGAARRTSRLELHRGRDAEIFGAVYQRNVWGTDGSPYYSGGGSDQSASEPYVNLLRAFVARQLDEEPPVVVDIGCGDFRVGALLVASMPMHYIGVDVVPALVEHNQRCFGSQEVSFVCLDAVTEELPRGQILLIRQLFQHLSNASIQRVLGKLGGYEHVFVTEHYPCQDQGVVPNLDKPHGPDIRLPWSAVYLNRPPFSLRSARCVLRVTVDEGSELRTYHVNPALEASDWDA